jgi:hypothetical protein
MAPVQYDAAKRPRNWKWFTVGVTSFSFLAAVVGAFYFGSLHGASPIGTAPQSAVTRDTPANASKGADDANAPASPARAPVMAGNADNVPDDPDSKGAQWVIDTDNKYGSDYPVGRHSTKVVFGYGLMYKADAALPLEQGMGIKATNSLIVQCKSRGKDDEYAASRAYEDTIERVVQDYAIEGMLQNHNDFKYRSAALYVYNSDTSNADYRILEDVAKQRVDVTLDNAGVGDCP